MTCAPCAPIAALVLGPVQFDRPIWLWLLVLLLPLVVWIGRSSLAGLEGPTRWVVLAIRLVVIAILVGVLADPSTRRRAEDVAVTLVLDASRSVPTDMQDAVDRAVEAAAQDRPNRTDRLGVITAAEDAYVQAMPSQRNKTVERRFSGGDRGTDLATAIRLAMATSPKDAAMRLVLASDGNETAGSLLEAARAAKAVGAPIDVIPLRYRYESEVIVDRVIVPANARQGQTINVKIAITATAPASGHVYLRVNDELVDLDRDGPGMGAPIDLEPGVNLHSVQVDAGNAGAKRFEATFEPLMRQGRPVGDDVIENNRALAVTFVSGEGSILLVGDQNQHTEPLGRVLIESGLAYTEILPDQLPADLELLSGHDAIILANVAADDLSEAQQEALRRYIHDAGGGLIMSGGDKSYGAGGWIGSPLADALPIRLDPPQRREMPKGALVLIMHSIEMPRGVFYGKKTAEAAVNTLAPQDLAGIIEYRGMTGRGADWVHPLTPVGDKSAVRRSIAGLQFGDMPSFDPSLRLALAGLVAADAGQKHCILISDGDPSLTPSLLQQFVDNRISISTVGVNPHSPSDLNVLQNMARATRGRFYNIPNSQIASIPEIFIKEARIVKRSLIWEGSPLAPVVQAVGSDAMRQIDGVPQVSGYVVTADREGLSRVTIRIGKENDPLLAEWQHGLGRVVTFMSDGGAKWATAWPSWGDYHRFWDQHIRWAMRPTGSANLRILTEQRADDTLLTLEALDVHGERLGIGAFEARVARPDGTSAPIVLRQVGPGRWEASFPSREAGTYVVGVVGAAPNPDGGDPLKLAVQAAVTKPFADEFRALEDNAALLRQVASETGGRVLFEVALDRGQPRISGNPQQADLFSRDGLVMPVATRSIWLALAIVGLTLFIADVGVRRVRIEPRAIVAAVRRAFSKNAEKAGKQMESLQAARAKARLRIDARASAPEHSRRKFEATPEQLAAARDADAVLSGQAEGRQAPAATSPSAPTDKKSTDAGLSRLMAAKKRAREEMGDETKES